MPLNNSTNRYSNSRYIVDNVSAGSPYTTVQSAINDAHANGGNADIFIRQGTYTENLTLYDTINIEGAEQTLSIIVGTHTPPASGEVRFARVGLQSATHIFSSAVAGSTTLSCLRCQFNLTNGYIYNLTNWTGNLRIRWCIDYSTANGIAYNAGGSAITINHSILGAGTANVFTANGNCEIFSVDFYCPSLFNGAGTSVLEGGSVFSGNVATAGTHALTLAQVRIITGTAQGFTHNSATTCIMNEVIVNSTNANAIGGNGTIQMMTVEFPNSNVLAGTLTTALTGVTRTAEVWADNLTRQNNSGFYSWAAAGPYFDDTTLGTFKLLVGGTGYILGKRVTWVAQNYVGMTAGNTYYIYIDSTGTIGAATTRTDALFVNNIVLFECLRDNTSVTNNQLTTKENHPYSFPSSTSNYLHDSVGVIIENSSQGANITLNGTQGIQINGADVLDDHGLTTTIPDSGGSAVTWIRMYTDAGGKWVRQNATTTFTGYYNNAGTATALSANKYAVYTLYALKDNANSSTPLYMAVLDTSQYNTAALASSAISAGTTAIATNELFAMEPCQLGYIVYAQSSSSITSVIISKATLRSGTSTAGTNQGSLVNLSTANFNGWLSSSNTNVQSALDELDDSTRYTEITSATKAMAVNRSYSANRATLVTFTLPATAIVGDEVAVTGIGNGGWLIAQNANQYINVVGSTTTVGVGGSLASTSKFDSVKLVCTVTNNGWNAVSMMGNITIV
jgi:hypothetical protein